MITNFELKKMAAVAQTIKMVLNCAADEQGTTRAESLVYASKLVEKIASSLKDSSEVVAATSQP